jgi:predicted membrane-bound dolichyl-phosphate-mannose-protein mannosyltransferase
MACDNLLLVHGRIATLDIYTVAMMIWGMALYLRGQPLLAGVTLGIAAAFKLVAPYLWLSLVVLEAARCLCTWRRRGYPSSWGLWPAAKRLVICTLGGFGTFIGLLALMDGIATPYADAEGKLITGGPFAHLSHMISYAAQQTSPNGPSGIASYPWQWLLDLQPITYLRINPSLPEQGLFAIHPVSKFLGVISPPIIALAIPALLFCVYRFVRLPRVLDGARLSTAPGETQLAVVGVAWFLGTWIPFQALSVLDSRTSYIYYMVVVMPGIYVAIASLLSKVWRLGRWPLSALIVAWVLGVLVAAVLLYPFVPAF